MMPFLSSAFSSFPPLPRKHASIIAPRRIRNTKPPTAIPAMAPLPKCFEGGEETLEVPSAEPELEFELDEELEL
jgi:hypothetical protein